MNSKKEKKTKKEEQSTKIVTENQEELPGTIFAIFKTNLPEDLKVEENEINISTDLNERELSKMIIQILSEEKGENISEKTRFEFLINNDFLRGNLKSHIFKHNLNTETTIIINYCLALQQPTLKKSQEEEDWISSIGLLGQIPNEKSPYAVSLFNGNISIYSSENDLLLRKKLTTSEIKAIRLSESKTKKNTYQLVCACSDQNLRIFDVHSEESLNKESQKKKGKKGDQPAPSQVPTITPHSTGKGHEASVESVDFHPLDSELVCSGAYDGSMIIWKISDEMLTSGSYKNKDGSSKKLKLSTPELQPSTRLSNLHFDSISRIIWAQANTIITGSLDHHIKMINVDKKAEYHEINCKDTAVTALAYVNNLVFSGHEDAYIKLWDTRSKEKRPERVFKSHNIWVSDIEFLPGDEYIFASSGYDNNVKIWDVRSDFPLFTMKAHTDKVFSLAWNGDKSVLSGGADSKVCIHSF